MSQYKDVAVGSTVYFWFAANTTAGTAGDGATPLYDVRLAGASSSGAPTASGTPTLLTHANYTDGLHEIAIDTTGYSAGEYAVFCTLTISAVNPAGFCGSFVVRSASSTLYDFVTAIKAKTDSLTFTVSNQIDANVLDWKSATAPAMTGDAYARLGAPAGASIAADIAARASQTSVDTIDDFLDTEIAAIKAKTDNLPASPAAVGSAMTLANDSVTAAALAADAVTEIQSGLATQASVDTIDDFLDTEIAAIKAKTDNLPADPAGVSDIPTAVENADALLNRDMATGTDTGSETVRTVRQALRFLRNKWSLSGTTLTVTAEDDSTASWTATVTTNASADPITASDPASS
jgi:hypothetical protein